MISNFRLFSGKIMDSTVRDRNMMSCKFLDSLSSSKTDNICVIYQIICKFHIKLHY